MSIFISQPGVSKNSSNKGSQDDVSSRDKQADKQSESEDSPAEKTNQGEGEEESWGQMTSQ